MQSQKTRKLTTLNFQTSNVWNFMEESVPEFVKTAVREALTCEAEKAGLPAPTFSREELNAPKGENTFAMLRAIIKRADAEKNRPAEGGPRLMMTKNGKHPLTPQGAARRVAAAAKAAREQIVKTSQQAQVIETLLTKPRVAKSVRYALRAVLVELSNESQVGVDTPGVAGAFYRAACESVETADLRKPGVAITFRHLNVLLANPTDAIAQALIKFWDAPGADYLKRDPFPPAKAKALIRKAKG
jgi:hypothetical protein